MDEVIEALRHLRGVVDVKDELGLSVGAFHEAVADAFRAQILVDDVLELVEALKLLELVHVELGVAFDRGSAVLFGLPGLSLAAGRGFCVPKLVARDCQRGLEALGGVSKGKLS